jgi:hypothetical protein
MDAFSIGFQPRTVKFIALCIALFVFGSGALTAQKDEHRVRNVVLVHGAWADGPGRKGVYDILTEHGYNVSIVTEPAASLWKRSNSGGPEFAPNSGDTLGDTLFRNLMRFNARECDPMWTRNDNECKNL